MNLVTRIYVTNSGCDDRDAAVGLMRLIGAELREIGAHRAGIGWNAIAVADQQDFDDFDVDPELLAEHTQGRLPLVTVTVSFDLDRGADRSEEVDALIARHQLQHVITF